MKFEFRCDFECFLIGASWCTIPGYKYVSLNFLCFSAIWFEW